MADEIKRNRWSQFFKKFSAANQYRQSTILVEQKGKSKAQINHDAPFLGIAVTKQGRLIDGIRLYTGQNDPEKISQPVLSIKEPVKIEVEKDSNGLASRLAVHSEDGTVARVILSGERDAGRFHSYVEEVAYRIAERRGFGPGNHVDDWLEAEKKIKETELELI
jgi:predicted RNA-binding protein YlqC (UPF0109 family)